MTIHNFKHIKVKVKRMFGRVDYEAACPLAELFVESDTQKRGSKAIPPAKIRELQRQGWTVEELQ